MAVQITSWVQTENLFSKETNIVRNLYEGRTSLEKKFKKGMNGKNLISKPKMGENNERNENDKMNERVEKIKKS